ncbi:hypothetical protein PLICRDRAFT_99140 [Plicaturopsis crispa FD-325 SS-3]|nr:hypothetical protein PLICRDRAFT_99140 [Plicaturopsis crispa FD-325 SS-3]
MHPLHTNGDPHHAAPRPHSEYYGVTVPNVDDFEVFWDRLRGKDRRWITWGDSAKAIATSSWLNLFVIFIPLAWASHFATDPVWPHNLVFILCFLAIIPLEHLFDYGGEQMAFYVGKDLGDLISITLNNAVEAALAIFLLVKCELLILQSTIVGVVLLHLLLIPGTAFITGGARIWEQHLNPHFTQLNHTLLTIGVLTLLLPAAFFAALDRGVLAIPEAGSTAAAQSVVNDTVRGQFLQISRGLSIILLIVYVGSRIYLHNPPGEDNALRPHPDAPIEIKHEEAHLKHADPEINPWACMLLLVLTVGLMAPTAEWLVDSIEFVREQGNIQEAWFGLVLLPIVSFAADGAIAIGYFAHSALRMLFGVPQAPTALAKGRAIDLSIQFTLFWMPFLVLLGWWTHKPMTLLFDFFEVALLLGATFLVNYVTADSKTNWMEGWMMVSFYVMIALTVWFYPGQPEIAAMVNCGSVASVLAGEGGAE